MQKNFFTFFQVNLDFLKFFNKVTNNEGSFYDISHIPMRKFCPALLRRIKGNYLNMIFLACKTG